MIKIERRLTPIIEEFDSAVRESKRRLEEIYTEKRKQRSKRLTRIDIGIVRKFKRHLLELFNGKCVFCEIPLDLKNANIHWFRPRSDAADVHGKKTSPPHYWWLAYEWDNLYISCSTCARHKGNRFPVQGKRASEHASPSALRKERPLLLDPCLDDPQEHLEFSENGRVTGITIRGDTTIEVFGLNRKGLISQRRTHVTQLLEAIEVNKAVRQTPKAVRTVAEKRRYSSSLDRLNDSRRDGSQFTMASRGLLDHFQQGFRVDFLESMRATFSSADIKQEPPTVAASDTTSVWMTSVEICNFRALEDVSFVFPDVSTELEEEPWLMLLGENGLGKSSVLKAIALPYLVANGNASSLLDPSSCLRDGARPASGHVTISFSNDQAATVRFGKQFNGFKMEGHLPNIPLLAYGATRLPPPPGEEGTTISRRVRLENLFDPRAPLSDAEPWLANTKRVKKSTFDNLSSALLTLMSADEGTSIERRSGKLYVRMNGARVPLRDMSDGYQSVLALATDIMINLAGDWDSMSSAEGTVLLDEIEVHLHPKWKLDIVAALRRVFPRVRFVVTTHDPLCLHGLNKGELHRLFLDQAEQKITLAQTDIPKGLRADQLLTGAWFGLTTTIDDDTQRLFREYTQLLRDGTGTGNEPRLRQLRTELKERTGGVGETALERVALGVAADLMDEASEKDRWDPATARAKIMERMKRIQASSTD